MTDTHDFSDTKEHKVAMAGVALRSAVNELSKMATDPELRDLLAEDFKDLRRDYTRLAMVLSILEIRELV